MVLKYLRIIIFLRERSEKGRQEIRYANKAKNEFCVPPLLTLCGLPKRYRPHFVFDRGICGIADPIGAKMRTSIAILVVAVVAASALAQQVEYFPAWTATNGSNLNSPWFHPASGGGVACFALRNFDVTSQSAECVFTNADDNTEFGRSNASVFSFLDELSRFPEALPSIGNENQTRLQAAINDSSTLNEFLSHICCSLIFTAILHRSPYSFLRVRRSCSVW
jgi:hypothetical protein